MTRFIALVWDDRDEPGVHQASTLRESLTQTHAWTVVTDRAGLAIYVPLLCDGEPLAISLRRDAGVILGTVFERSASTAAVLKRQATIGESETHHILHTRGRSLIDTHWGSYILFLRCPEEHLIRVLRGPCGTLPCHYLSDRRLTMLFTHAADLHSLHPSPLSINWDSIRAQAAAGDYLTRETGLTDVHTIISGECIDIHEGRVTHRAYWNPATLCADPIKRLPEAAALLHREAHRCVGAWASRHESLLLLLSGGLDSSIVLSCLQYAPVDARVIAVNFYSEGGGDERRFARSMVARTQTPLEEVASNLHINLRDFPRCALTVSPVLNFTAFDVEPVMRALARRWNATAIFTGETGDDVLGHAPMPEALSDLLQRPRQLHRFLSASLDYAELSRISIWGAMALALRNRRRLHHTQSFSIYRHRQLAGYLRASSLISDEAADHYETMIERFLHPWFQVARAPLGKRMLLYSIIQATSSVSHSPFEASDTLPTFHPLMSQPLIEAALRISSDLHFYRAENGAVARAAFREALSPEVLERGTGKGTPAAWARHLLDTNAPYLRELLLEGMLVEQRILDRAKIEMLLSTDVNRSRVGMAELIRQVYIELWLRRWAEQGAHL